MTALARPSAGVAGSGAAIPAITRHGAIGRVWAIVVILFACSSAIDVAATSASGNTVVTIQNGQFFINGRPTYEHRTYQGANIEGLLLNARMVQGIFDDLNPATRPRFAYPDTGRWDPQRNTDEFVDAMQEWRRRGLNCFTLNMQGGSPFGYGNSTWRNSAYDAHGVPRPQYLHRLEQILDRADQLEMVVILGLFYFGQDQHLKDEPAIWRAVDEMLAWLARKRFRHVLIELNNECDSTAYDHAILRPDNVDRLIQHVRESQPRRLVGTSFSGGVAPTPKVAAASDFLLIHGNGVNSPDAMRRLIERTKAVRGTRRIPIVVNEDDHYAFDQPDCNFKICIQRGVSWGFFDYRREGEGFADGYQSVPVDWSISSARKHTFFQLVGEIAGVRTE